jgi:hypothetical protein
MTDNPLMPLTRLRRSVEVRAMRLKSVVKQWALSRIVSPLDWHAEPGVPLACIVGEGHVPMLWHSLKSLQRWEDVLPPLIIAADSANAATALQRVFSSRAKMMKLVMWNEAIEAVPLEWRGFISRYLAHPRWSCMGKKLAFILSLNAKGDFVYSDSDMLWYGPVLREANTRLAQGASGVCVARDALTSYDVELLRWLRFDFKTTFPLNAGFLAMRRGSLIDALQHHRLTGWHTYEGPFGVHTEQTLVACAADCVDGFVFPSDMVGISMGDGGSYTRKFTPRVRHYVGPKTLFWRDC